MKQLFALLLFTAGAAMATDPPQFTPLLTDSTDYTCSGTAPCATWPSPTIPAPGGTYTDPTWGTTTTRLQSMTTCAIDSTHTTACSARSSYPDYSKQEPWNSDGTKLLILDSEAWYHLYDAATLTDLARITGASGLCCDDDVRWSHSDPNLIYYRSGMSLKSYNINTHAVTTLHTFACTDGVHSGTSIGNGDEGNSDINDRYWPEVCSYYDGSYNASLAVIVYDRQTDVETANVPVATICGGSCSGFSKSDLINWVGMSPSGGNVIIQWNKNSNVEANYVRPMGTELFDPNLNYIGKICASNGHGDVGYDVNGVEVYVSQWNLTYDNRIMKWRKLSDLSEGKIPFPSTWTNDALYHISMRAQTGAAKGWALISSAKSSDSQGVGWGASELVAVKIDTTQATSQVWRRIGRTMSIRDTQYYAEPHAVPNWNFTKVLWGSDWITDGGQLSPFQISLPLVGNPPVITTSSLAPGRVGFSYFQALAATGDAPITWSVALGVLPSWARLNASTGAITGTPDAVATTDFTIRATNDAGTIDKALSLTVAAPRPVITGRASITGSFSLSQH